MSSKKYKTLRSIYIISKLNYALKKSVFIGFFQLKSLDFENSIQIKQLTFGLNLKTFICKNSFLKQNKLLPLPLLSSIQTDLYIQLINLLSNHNIKINNIFRFSNSNIQTLLRI